MARPVPVPHAAKVNILWTDGGDSNVLTGLHFAYTGDPPNAADCASLASQIYAPVSTNLRAQCQAGVSLRGVDFTDLSSDIAQSGSYRATNAGGLSGGPLPAGVAALVNYGISRKYRGGKPRSYWPFGDDGRVATPSSWTTSFQTDVNNALSSTLAAIAGLTAGATVMAGLINIGYNHGYGEGRARSNGHLYYPPLPRVTPVVDPITSHNLNLKFGSQRRRYQHSA